jgi:hypothetical protein
MRTHDQPLARHDPAARVDPYVGDVPWVSEGILAGVVGAATIALFFLALDFAEGRPFWTPNALGSFFFRGTLPEGNHAIEPALVAGYTLLHGAVFAAVGLMAAFELLSGTRLPGSRLAWRGLVLALLLFVGFEAVFFCFDAFAARGPLRLFGLPRVSLANALAALAMAGLLVARAQRRGLRPSAEV